MKKNKEILCEFCDGFGVVEVPETIYQGEAHVGNTGKEVCICQVRLEGEDDERLEEDY